MPTEEPATADPAPVATEEAAATPDPEAAPNGAAIFAANCATCHGATGMGTGRGPNIASIGQFYSSDASPIVGLVTNGGTNMPSFGAKLTTDEISAVVQYVVATFR